MDDNVVITKPKTSTITMIVSLSEQKIDIDFYEFCYLLIKENRLVDENNDLYSVEYYPKGNAKNHQVLRHFPFGVPDSKKKKKRKKKKSGSFHNQCSFYCKIDDGYIVNIMMFSHPKLKICGLRRKNIDHIIVAERFVKEFNYFFVTTNPILRKSLTLPFRYFNEETMEVETREWVHNYNKILVYDTECVMFNRGFNINYELDLDEVIDVFCDKYHFHAGKKKNYSGVICRIKPKNWSAPPNIITPEIAKKYNNNFELQSKVHLFLFSTGKIIMIFKYERDSNLIYDFVRNIFHDYKDQLISRC